jgi:hypothetical protein
MIHIPGLDAMRSHSGSTIFPPFLDIGFSNKKTVGLIDFALGILFPEAQAFSNLIQIGK